MALDFDLLIVSDARPRLLARVEQALHEVQPGRVALLLREPQRTTRALLELADTMRALTRRHGARLLLSDRIDVALAVGADGVQLPEASFSPGVARTLLGPRALIGVSRHTREGLLSAAAAGADYATLSPVHPVDGKAPPLGLAGFSAAIAGVALPVFALGGVRHDDVAALRTGGAHGIAVMREVLASDRPAVSVARLLAALAPR